MHEEFIDTIRKAFTVGGDDAKRDAIAAMQLLLGALGAAPPPTASSPPIATATAPAPDPVSLALDALITKFKSMLPAGVEVPNVVDPAHAIPFVPVPTWNNG